MPEAWHALAVEGVIRRPQATLPGGRLQRSLNEAMAMAPVLGPKNLASLCRSAVQRACIPPVYCLRAVHHPGHKLGPQSPRRKGATAALGLGDRLFKLGPNKKHIKRRIIKHNFCYPPCIAYNTKPEAPYPTNPSQAPPDSEATRRI